ncbi:hypothetical protein E2C01_045791 [Portunus trituberculatus]|uniref:Uncharacterized protein n=1 Tax=Portunus trituberculatus TaxID=210409 RepID=A0A5B7G5Y9_PORTR|nr:hypothetical protein [Portunus trituberculatus]
MELTPRWTQPAMGTLKIPDFPAGSSSDHKMERVSPSQSVSHQSVSWRWLHPPPALFSAGVVNAMSIFITELAIDGAGYIFASRCRGTWVSRGRFYKPYENVK